MHSKTRNTIKKEIALRTFIFNEAKTGNAEAMKQLTRICEIEQDIYKLKLLKRQRANYSRVDIYRELRNLELQKKVILRTFDHRKWKAKKYLSELRKQSNSL